MYETVLGVAILISGFAFGTLFGYNRGVGSSAGEKSCLEGISKDLIVLTGKQSDMIIESHGKVLNAALVSSENQIDRVNAEAIADAAISRNQLVDKHLRETNYVDETTQQDDPGFVSSGV